MHQVIIVLMNLCHTYTVCWCACKQPWCVWMCLRFLFELPVRASSMPWPGWMAAQWNKGAHHCTIQPTCWIHNERWIYSPHLCYWINIFQPPFPLPVFGAWSFISNWDLFINARGNKSQTPGWNIAVFTGQCQCFSEPQPRQGCERKMGNIALSELSDYSCFYKTGLLWVWVDAVTYNEAERKKKREWDEELIQSIDK